MTRLFGSIVLAAVLATPVLAQRVDVERQAAELESMLIAPCCFSQQVSIHQSPAAAEVRVDIRRRLAAGETRDQILQAYTDRYGKRVLAQPPAEGFDWVLHLLPPVGLFLTAGFIVLLVRRFASRGEAAQPAEAGAARAPETRYDAALDEQLRDLD